MSDSAASAPPPPTEKKTPDATATVSVPASGFGAVLGGLAVLPIIFLIVFHSGAAYLSYQKYQSGMWAFVDFLFPYLYYPYYAFFLSGCPVEQSMFPTLAGGVRRMLKLGRRR
jgi:hypothetical protein